MKNITVTVQDEIYLHARTYAALRSTSVSALVQRFLTALGDDLPDRVQAPPTPRKSRRKL